eukprot:7017479-Prymnesium_polylepis.1
MPPPTGERRAIAFRRDPQSRARLDCRLSPARSRAPRLPTRVDVGGSSFAGIIPRGARPTNQLKLKRANFRA